MNHLINKIIYCVWPRYPSPQKIGKMSGDGPNDGYLCQNFYTRITININIKYENIKLE